MPPLIVVFLYFYNRNTGADDCTNFKVSNFVLQEGNRIKFSFDGNQYYLEINSICYNIDTSSKAISSVDVYCNNVL